MNDTDDLKAACCLAGADSDVTLEELQLLGSLAAKAGLEPEALRARIEKTHRDETFRQQMIDAAMDDADSTMTRLIALAHEIDTGSEGHATMLLWRMATKLEMSPERFEGLMAPS